MDQLGGGPTFPAPFPPTETVVEAIQGAVNSSSRRLLVLGPPGSRRLDSVRRALTPLGFKVVVLDIRSVRSRKGLDRALRRLTGERDFYRGMRRLEHRALRRLTVLIVHGIDGCAGSPAEDHVFYRIWSEVCHHCRSPIVVFTAKDSEFVARYVALYKSFRSYVRIIRMRPDGKRRGLRHSGPRGAPS
jgi:hypothetical protein